MPAPASVEELVELIRKSAMIDEQKLTDYLSRHRDAATAPATVKDCADDMVRAGLLTNFQAEQFLLGKWRGFTVGKYKLLERIGVGGMGQVFLCEHLYLKRRAALKILPPAKAEQPAALGRFYREARVAASLQHPNVVRTHDIDKDDAFHFIVMDYVDGPNLLGVVKRFGPLDVGRAVSYVRQVALALDVAFQNQIVHRDVKPGNILIDRKGVARLLDLGLARFINDHNDQLTLKYDDKLVLGTADYVAPEQIQNSHTVDIRADIYALGGTFYFLLVGHPPFPEGSVRAKLIWHKTKEPTPVRELRPQVPAGLAAVVEKMLAKDPKHRFQTPAQVVTALEEWLPELVPLPRDEEMPRLSPAAMAELDEPSSAIEVIADLDELESSGSGPSILDLSEPEPPAPEQPTGPAAEASVTATTDADSDSPFGPPPFPYTTPWSRGKVTHEDTMRDRVQLTPSEPTPRPYFDDDSADAQVPAKPAPAATRSARWVVIATVAVVVLAVIALLVSVV